MLKCNADFLDNFAKYPIFETTDILNEVNKVISNLGRDMSFVKAEVSLCKFATETADMKMLTLHKDILDCSKKCDGVYEDTSHKLSYLSNSMNYALHEVARISNKLNIFGPESTYRIDVLYSKIDETNARLESINTKLTEQLNTLECMCKCQQLELTKLRNTCKNM